MIRHIVEFKLSSDDPQQRATDALGIQAHLTGLLGVVPTVNSIVVANDLGLVGGHWDVVLVSEHDSNADLEAYQAHPAHKEAAGWVSTVVSDRATVDYEY
jgi:hypothetical protein